MEGRSYSGGISKGRDIEIVIDDKDFVEREKWCYQCRKWLSVKLFSKNRSQHDGLNCECKKCDAMNKKNRKKRK
jgi:hypothetical protein